MMDSISIKAIRVNLNLTQKEFSKKIGMPFSTYQRKESGESKFTFKEVRKISEISGIDINLIRA